MRDAGDRWDDVDVVEAAAGVKINGPNLEQVLAGTTLRLSNTAEQAAVAHEKALEEARIGVELDEEGVVIKADTLGGLEALAFELGKLDIPIRSATIGHVSKRDFITAENAGEPLHNVILAFSTKPLAEIATLLDDDDCPVKYIDGRIIYHIIEQLSEWRDERTRQLEAEQREALVFPGRIQILADHIFRRSGPAVVGIKVLGGRIHVGQHLMRSDGKRVGQIKSIRTGESGMQEAEQGDEVAVERTAVQRVEVPGRNEDSHLRIELERVEEPGWSRAGRPITDGEAGRGSLPGDAVIVLPPCAGARRSSVVHRAVSGLEPLVRRFGIEAQVVAKVGPDERGPGSPGRRGLLERHTRVEACQHFTLICQ